MFDYSQESWKSTASDISDASDLYRDGGKNGSYFNSTESRMTPREHPFGRIPSPQHSSTSNEYHQRLPGGSANTSYESIGLGSYNNSNNFSGTSDSEFGHMTPVKKPGSDISAVLQSMQNQNLHVRTKDNVSYSLSESSDRSGMNSFPSDVSYETVDQSQMSFASRSSTSSQPAVSSKGFTIVMTKLEKLLTGLLTRQTMSCCHRRLNILPRLQWPLSRGKR